MPDEDELGAGLEASDAADDFDQMVADFMATDENPAQDEPVPVMDTAPDVAPTVLPAPAEAVAEAAEATKKPRGRKPKPAAEATVPAEPEENADAGGTEADIDFDSLPESTKLEMAAGRAALLARAT